METNRLRLFCVICETGNMREAARLVNLSHSALSKSMKVLQEELGMDLLLPDGRGIQISDKGKELYPRFKSFLKGEEQLLNFTPKDETRFRIATFEVFSTHLLPQVWHKYFPDTPFDLHEHIPGRMESVVVEGMADAAITYDPVPTQGLDFLKIGKIGMGIYSRGGSFKGVSWQDIPFVAPLVPVSNTPSGVKGLDGWPEDKFPRKVTYQVDMMESGLSLARMGKGAIFIPHFVARLHNKVMNAEFALKELPAPPKMREVQREVYLIKRKSTIENKNIKVLAKLLRQECVEN